jgi:D-alanyl-D-alanine carboxypeptidase
MYYRAPSASRWILPVAAAFAVLAGAAGGASASSATTDDSAPETSGLNVVEDELDAATSEALGNATAVAFGGASTPGAVMAVRTVDGTWVATIGSQDLDGTTPMTADVNQRIGSITKTFTVTALLQLAEQDALSLDDPIGDYVAGTPNPDATLGQLAAMRSGIPSYTFDEGFQEQLFGDPHRVWTPEQLVDFVRGGEADFAPGEATSYSNTNTILLGLVIEEVTGQPLNEVIEERIIVPLGLDATTFPTDASFAEPHARGYTVQGQDERVPVDATDWNPSWGWSAGAMISDLDDLLVYGDALVAGDVLLSPEMQAERIDSFDFSIPPNTPAFAYGLGLGLANGWYGHTGELPGYNTAMQHHLDEGITVIVMVNSDIRSGDCPADAPTVEGGRTDGPCEDPAVHVANALTAALGHPLVVEGTPTPATSVLGSVQDVTVIE